MLAVAEPHLESDVESEGVGESKGAGELDY